LRRQGKEAIEQQPVLDLARSTKIGPFRCFLVFFFFNRFSMSETKVEAVSEVKHSLTDVFKSIADESVSQM
jgi:hypothetical protein